MASKGFYHNWPEEYLQGLFRHRQDPRWHISLLESILVRLITHPV
jgi:hypothetical protein